MDTCSPFLAEAEAIQGAWVMAKDLGLDKDATGLEWEIKEPKLEV